MGAALVMVTLAVGIGVVGNFSGDDRKRADEAALSQLGENSYNTFPGGISRSDLERQLSSGQEGNTARFLRTSPDGNIEEDDNLNGEFMPNEGFVYGEGANYGQGGSAGGMEGYARNLEGGPSATADIGGFAGGVNANQAEAMYGQGTQSEQEGQNSVRSSQDKLNQMYAQGGVPSKGVRAAKSESNKNTAFTVKGKKSINTFSGKSGSADTGVIQGGAAGSGSAEAKAAATKEAASKAEKAKKDREERNRIRRETQINRLASAGGGSSSFSSSGGSSSGGSSLGGAIQGDTSSRPVLGANSAPAATDNSSSGFKAGRGGNMGGFNVARSGYAGSGEGASPKGGSGDRSAINQMAYSFSASKNAARLTSEGSKEAARDAFEQNGENDTGAVIESGASIKNAISQLPDSGTVGDTPSAGLLGAGSGIEAKEKQLEDLQDDLGKAYWELILGTLAISIGVWLLSKIGSNISGPWGVAIMIAAMLAMLAGILFVVSMNEKIMGIIEDIMSPDLSTVNDSISREGMENCANITSILVGLLPPAAFALGILGDTKFGAKLVGWAVKSGAGATELVATGLGKIVGVIGGIGALVGVGTAGYSVSKKDKELQEKKAENRRKKQEGGD